MIDQGIRYTEMSTGKDQEQIYPTHQVESVSEQQLHHRHWMSKGILVYQEESVSEPQLHHNHSMWLAMLVYQEMSVSVPQLLRILLISMVKSSTMDGIDLVEIRVCTMKPMDEVSI